MPNENCLEGMACPKCGHDKSFAIGATVTMLLRDDGTNCDLSGYEWDDNSSCSCRNCEHSGTVKDFKTPSPPTTLKMLVDRLRALKDEHEQLEDNRDCDDFDMSYHSIDQRENEIYAECFEIAQDIVGLNLGS